MEGMRKNLQEKKTELGKAKHDLEDSQYHQNKLKESLSALQKEKEDVATTLTSHIIDSGPLFSGTPV